MKQPPSVSGKRPSYALAIPFTLLVVWLSTRFGGFFSLPPSNISAFWPANALLFSAVFLLPARQAGMTLLLAVLAYAGAELWIGYSLQNAFVYGFANVAEVTFLLWLLRQTGTRSLAFDRLKDLFLLLSLAMLASPVGGAIGAMEATHAGGAFGTVFLRWSLADFFGYCLCVPLVLTWRQWRQTFAFESPARIMEFTVLLIILVLVSVFASGVHFFGLSAPLGAQFLPLPVLLWAALRFGPPGGAIATVIVACVTFFSATHGVGLFAARAPEENVASLQLFFAALVITVMTIASLNAERKQSLDAMQQEVAERQQAQEALKNSEALLNTTQRLSKVGGWEFDVKTGKSFWTEELYRIHDIPNDSGIDLLKASLACFRPEDKKILNDAFQRACELGEPYDLELPFTTCTGKPLWIRTTAQPVYDDGKVMRLVGNLMDVTEQKQVADALRLSSERLQLATRVANIGIWDWDIPKNELVWDDSMYQLYGMRKGDFGGAYDAWISAIHPEDMAHTDGEIQAALRGDHEYAPEFRIIRSDGTIRHIKADSRTTRDPDGKPLRMIGTNIDITALKQAEVSIRMLNQTLEQRVARRTVELQAANKELESIAYTISHDLRAPLRHIDGFLSLLRVRTAAALDDKSRHYMDTISNAAKRMGAMVDDLLALLRMGRREMTVERVDLGALLREAIAEFEVVTTGRGIDWRIGELPVVTGDRAMLRMVFLNLISNALKFTQKRAKAEIEIGSMPDHGTQTCVYVRDNGIGFDMQYVHKLFGVFQRLQGNDEFEGTGIGLANVRRIISRHGGKTWAQGQVDGGATFYFSLPECRSMS